MRLEEETAGSVTVVEIAGRLDGFSAPDLESRVKEIIERGDVQLLLDCEKMEYISSAGLRAVIVGAKGCQQRNGKLALCSLQPECKSVFEVSGFMQILDCYDTRDSALAAVS